MLFKIIWLHYVDENGCPCDSWKPKIWMDVRSSDKWL